MKPELNMKNCFLLLLALTVFTIRVSAQCDEYSYSYNSLTTGLFSPPCVGDSISTSWQVWQSEAYLFEAVEGGNYTFNICEYSDPDFEQSWTPEFTIKTPGGTLQSFGSGDNNCSVTWTASETGAHWFIINEADSCGQYQETDNGHLVFTTNSGGMECFELSENYQDFSTDSLPSCWSNIDVDADTQAWQLQANMFENETAVTSYSYTNTEGVLTPDNYLITPLLQLGDEEVLRYVVSTLDEDFPGEHYGVYVSTTTSDPASFELVFQDSLESQDVNWHVQNIDLSAYNNQSLYLAFRHYNSTGNGGIALAHIELPGQISDPACLPTSVTENKRVEDVFSIYPNPGQGIFKVKQAQTSAEFQVQVLDMRGRVVATVNSATNSGSVVTVDISNQAKGVYLCKILSDSGVVTKKLVLE